MEIGEVKHLFDSRKNQHGIQFDLKDEQALLVQAVINGRNALGLLPTDFGKTLCFTAPSVIWENGTVIIISPLNALMDDQIQSLTDWQFKCIRMKTGLDKTVDVDLKSCEYDFIFASPEMVLSRSQKDIFLTSPWQKRVKLIVVDEAHCVLQWGEDFRPDYKNLHELRSFFPQTPVMALTATSTLATKKEIMTVLRLGDDNTTVIAQVPERPNIFIGRTIRPSSDTIEDTLKDIISHIRNKQKQSKKFIIYCRCISSVADVWHAMKSELGKAAYEDGVRDSSHILVEMFHTCTGVESRERILNIFKKCDSTIRCLVATGALGMGINIPDVDVIVHYGCPNDVVNYWQEVGRGARDGRAGYAFIISDRFTMAAQNTTKDMKNICEEKETCLRSKILNKFHVSGVSKNIVIVKEHCTGCEYIRCTCQACLCCEICRNKCPCQEKRPFSLSNFVNL